jgi:crotonobetainyl-CoA:carnitine CoA-transferase CaiB-like acyl-CoA transferase
VLDLTRMPPGAYCTVGLADLGADVIRIESPSAAGQPSRVVGQLSLGRGKRSATLDLRHERAGEVLLRLAGSADVLVENNPPGDLERRGFGYPQAAARHPRLIWCSITGFGQDGPYAAWPGHDLSYLAQSGLLAALSPDLPWHPSWMLAVPIGASFAMTGIVAALRERDATGKGCQIDISLSEAATWLLGGFDAALSDHPVAVPVDPGRRLYPCGDGKWISVAAAEPRTWKALCEGLGVPELAAELASTDSQREKLTQRLSEIFASRPAAEWLETLGPLGAAVGPVNVGGDVVRDPHNTARAATFEVGGVRVPANPIRMRDTSGARSTTATSEPGLVGEHTDAVLGEAGYGADEIRALHEEGVV